MKGFFAAFVVLFAVVLGGCSKEPEQTAKKEMLFIVALP